MRKSPMTASGKEKLQEELEHLKRVARPEVITSLAEARAHGDLKENAEYHAARERQSFLEGRIEHLESLLAHSEVIDIRRIPHTGRVIFGATITLINIDNDETVVYQIVGEEEADIKQGRISVTSPLARAMIGKEVGDVIDVKTPVGLVSYEVSEVQHI
ncbi:MAG: transcription elongation factor GreA [Legionellales bacterium]|nr:transcription elongation factor GreA [Legionellales bacterium]